MTTHKSTIMSLYRAMFNKNYREAEGYVLGFVERVINRPRNNPDLRLDDMHMLDLLYRYFNEKYIAWVAFHKKDTEKEHTKQHRDGHPNYLLANCFDPSSMDDLLWELANYIENPTDAQKKEIQYQLDCYKNMLKK